MRDNAGGILRLPDFRYFYIEKNKNTPENRTIIN